MLPLSRVQIDEYNSAVQCWICQKDLIQSEKVRDHCHLVGSFRGAAHRRCNLRFCQNKKVPIFFHNFQGYDCHLLLRGLQNYSGKLKVIPINSQKFMSIIGTEFVFLDSMMFLSTSLDQLVQNLKQGLTDSQFDSKFKILISFFGKELAKMLSRKGVYPYEYMDKWSRFEEKKFPRRSKFFSSLNDTNVSMSDYEFGKNVFKTLCTTMGDYHDLYLMTDVLLLACVFENFRAIAIEQNDLDPVHYFSLAGYAWDLALYKSRQNLEQIVSVDMYNFIELGIRGGVFMISQRYAKSNNKYMDDYNPDEESSYIMLFDKKNNLYGEAMMAYLPVNDFKWLQQEEVSQLTESDILSWDDEAFNGAILMVDLSYPEKLHMLHNDYPLATEKVNIPENQLSQYQIDLKCKIDLSYSKNQKKLIPHLGPRINYVCHYRALKTWLKKGMKLEKIHKVVSFVQKPWLRDHVTFCTQQRTLATTEFEKSYWKFLVNSIFGKSGENLRKRVDVRIVTNKFAAKKLTCLSGFKTFQILDSCADVAIITLSPPKVKLTRPIYTAFSVLELSKVFMYDFYYDKAKKWCGEDVNLLMTDTDSFGFHIYTKDVFADMKANMSEFDLSDYPTTHELHSNINKKVIGKMKDEANGQILEEFCGLPPKMYSFTGKGVQKKAMKGIKKSMVKSKIRHSLVRRILKKQEKLHCTMNLIRSKQHNLFTINVDKAALHCFYSKRYIKSDGNYTLAHNHFILKTC